MVPVRVRIHSTGPAPPSQRRTALRRTNPDTPTHRPRRPPASLLRLPTRRERPATTSPVRCTRDCEEPDESARLEW